MEDSPSDPRREQGPAGTSASYFQPPGLRHNTCLWFYATQFAVQHFVAAAPENEYTVQA